MKETKINIKDKTEISAEVKQESKTLLGSIMLKKGQKLWEYCIKTGDMQPVEIETTSIEFEDAKEGNHSSTKKATAKEGHLYAVAINEKNALKKILKSFL